MSNILADEKNLQNSFARRMFTRYQFLATNVMINNFEADIFGIRKSGFADEIEIKISVNDFNNDFKKHYKFRESIGKHCEVYGIGHKHDRLESGERVPNYFSFLILDEMLDNIELPDYCGLYVYRNGMVSKIVNAPRLHSRKVSDSLKIELGTKMMYRFWKNRGVLN